MTAGILCYKAHKSVRLYIFDAIASSARMSSAVRATARGSSGAVSAPTVFATKLLEFLAERQPVFAVSGLFRTHFGIQGGAELVSRAAPDETQEWPRRMVLTGTLGKPFVQFEQQFGRAGLA